MAAPPTTTASKNINQQQQNVKELTLGFSKYTQEKALGLQPAALSK